MGSIFGKILSKYLIPRKLPCYILSRKPMIVVSYWMDFFNNNEKILSQLPSNKMSYCIFQLGYHVERAWRLDEVFEQYQEVQKNLNNKQIKFIFLANTQVEADLLKTKGLDTVFCNQNAFLDESRYKVLETKKKYDSLYLARITPIKRQELASEIKSLKLIGTYFEVEKKYFQERMKTLKNATWKKKVWAFNVFKHMAEAHTGLCLSQEEGAMFVSTEYLLCGLPVVSTESLGGRDIYYHEDYVRICKDSPKEVYKAVEELKTMDINPNYVRYRTIEIMNEHRLTFINLIQDIFDKEGFERDFMKEWPKVFTHKLGLRTSLPYGIAKHRSLTEDSWNALNRKGLVA